MRARRTDQNLSEIIGAARAAGFRVYVSNDILCDLTVQLGKATELWEAKANRGRLTSRQEELREAGWNIRTVKTIDDVLTARKEMLK